MAALHLSTAPLQMGGGSKWSYLFTLTLVVLFLSALGLVIIWNRYNRPDMDRDHAAMILSQLRTFGGGETAVVFQSEDAIQDDGKLADVRALFTSRPENEITVRSATSEIVGSVRAELAARKPGVSKVPRVAVEEAVLTAVFGAMAMLPIAWWESAASSSAIGLPEFGDVVISFPVSILSTSGDLIMAYPYVEVLGMLALILTILTLPALWKLWMVPPGVLLALAGSYWYLERRIDHDRDPSGPSIRGWSVRFVTLTFVIWMTGAGLAWLGALIGSVAPRFLVWVPLALGLMGLYAYLTRDKPHQVHYYPLGMDTESVREKTRRGAREGAELARVLSAHGFAVERHDQDRWDVGLSQKVPLPSGVNWKRTALVGFVSTGVLHPALALLASVVIAAVVIRYWIRNTLRRWRNAMRTDGRDAFALDVIHSVTVTAAAVTLPLMVSYVLYALGTGKLFAVTGVIIAAPSQTVIAMGLLAAVVTLAVAVTFLDRFRDVRRGFLRALSVQAVRTAVVARALPAVLMAVVAIILLGVGAPLTFTLIAAVILGVIARLLYMAVNYVTFRMEMRPSRERTASRVVVYGRKIQDSDGEPVYVAAVNGHRTAHRDLDRLVRQIQRDARSLFRSGSAEPGSFARYYYENGVLRGKVDLETVGDELIGDIRTRFKANVVQKDADAETILNKLRDEYPDNAVQRVVSNLKNRGRVRRTEDEFEWLGG